MPSALQQLATTGHYSAHEINARKHYNALVAARRSCVCKLDDNKSGKHPTNLTSSYGVSWKLEDGCREFFQNMMDHILESWGLLPGETARLKAVESPTIPDAVQRALPRHPTEFSGLGALERCWLLQVDDALAAAVLIYPEGAVLWQKYAILSREHIQFRSSKSKVAGLAGGFGEGMKVGALVIKRDGEPSVIKQYMPGEHWTWLLNTEGSLHVQAAKFTSYSEPHLTTLIKGGDHIRAACLAAAKKISYISPPCGAMSISCSQGKVVVNPDDDSRGNMYSVYILVEQDHDVGQLDLAILWSKRVIFRDRNTLGCAPDICGKMCREILSQRDDSGRPSAEATFLAKHLLEKCKERAAARAASWISLYSCLQEWACAHYDKRCLLVPQSWCATDKSVMAALGFQLVDCWYLPASSSPMRIMQGELSRFPDVLAEDVADTTMRNRAAVLRAVVKQLLRLHWLAVVGEQMPREPQVEQKVWELPAELRMVKYVDVIMESMVDNGSSMPVSISLLYPLHLHNNDQEIIVYTDIIDQLTRFVSDLERPSLRIVLSRYVHSVVGTVPDAASVPRAAAWMVHDCAISQRKRKHEEEEEEEEEEQGSNGKVQLKQQLKQQQQLKHAGTVGAVTDGQDRSEAAAVVKGLLAMVPGGSIDAVHSLPGGSGPVANPQHEVQEISCTTCQQPMKAMQLYDEHILVEEGISMPKEASCFREAIGRVKQVNSRVFENKLQYCFCYSPGSNAVAFNRACVVFYNLSHLVHYSSLDSIFLVTCHELAHNKHAGHGDSFVWAFNHVLLHYMPRMRSLVSAEQH